MARSSPALWAADQSWCLSFLFELASGVGPLHQRRWRISGATFDRAEQCADATTEMHTMKDPMSPIDYFMAIFTGMCIGVAGVAYVL